MNALRNAVTAAGERLARVSGGRIAVDPDVSLSRDAALELRPPGRTSSNGHTHLVEASDGWLAVTLARPEDQELLATWTVSERDPWGALRSRAVADAIADAAYLHMPVAQVGEAVPLAAPMLHKGDLGDGVIDLSALWAGPACGGYLAAAGLAVTKVESRTRADPTTRTTPELDQRLNGQKARQQMALSDPALFDRITGARVLITSARPHALARAGLSEERLFAANPGLLWVAITAHGWRGDAAMRVGFGDDCAAAGGLVQWVGDEPQFMGDALADPLTGIIAATLALEALDRGEAGLIDVPLARVAAHFAEAMH
jgi:hypothetical protein